MDQLTPLEKELLTVTEYFIDRKKTIDRYVEGEHKWFGNVEAIEIPSMNPNPRPWYLS